MTNKRKRSPTLIDSSSTCESLNVPYELLCEKYKERKCTLCNRRRTKKPPSCLKLWEEKYARYSNISQSRLLQHTRLRRYLGLAQVKDLDITYVSAVPQTNQYPMPTVTPPWSTSHQLPHRYSKHWLD